MAKVSRTLYLRTQSAIFLFSRGCIQLHKKSKHYFDNLKLARDSKNICEVVLHHSIGSCLNYQIMMNNIEVVRQIANNKNSSVIRRLVHRWLLNPLVYLRSVQRQDFLLHHPELLNLTETVPDPLFPMNVFPMRAK